MFGGRVLELSFSCPANVYNKGERCGGEILRYVQKDRPPAGGAERHRERSLQGNIMRAYAIRPYRKIAGRINPSPTIKIFKGELVMAEVFWGQVLPALVSLAAAAVCYGIGVLTNWIRQKADIDGKNHADSVISMALYEAERIVQVVVGKTEQTVAEQLRQDVKDGKADKSELDKLGSYAFMEVKRILGQETLDLIQLHLGDVNIYLGGLIENAVYQMKQNKVVPLPSGVNVQTVVHQDVGDELIPQEEKRTLA